MPRISRESHSTSFFHIIIQGINKEKIFSKEEYIKKYLSIMNKYKQEYKIEILSYCIMNNHAHLLIYVDQIKQMELYMHRIDGIYAQYYNKEENRVGVVFRNRYVSEPIYDERYLINCIHYIHFNPVQANIVNACEEYKYSSYKEFTQEGKLSKNKILKDIFGGISYLELCNSMYISEGDFYDVNLDKDKVLETGVRKFEEDNNLELKEILLNNEKLKELIAFLKSNYSAKYIDIMKKFNITKWEMEKLKW